MQRKLIQLSPSTAVVSIPAAWLRKNGLRKGAELSVTEQGAGLLIAPASADALRETEIDLSGLHDRAVWFAIDAAYIAGYDVITLRVRDAAQLAQMARVVRYFPGMIIEEERARSVRLRDMARGPAAELDVLMGRVAHATSTVLEEGVAALDARDRATLRDAKRRDYHINSYVSLCLRHLSKYGAGKGAQASAQHTRIKILEMAADKACAMLVELGTLSRPGAADRRLLRDALALYRRAQQVRAFTQVDEFERERSKAIDSAARADPAVRAQGAAFLDLLHALVEMSALTWDHGQR